MIEFIGIYPSSALRANWLNHGPIWEIMYCIEGHGVLATEGREVSYGEGDVIVQPPNVLHRLTPESDSRDIYLMVNETYPFDGIVTLPDTVDRDIRSLLMMMYRMQVRDVPGRNGVMMLLLNTLTEYINMVNSSTHRTKLVDAMENEIIKNLSNAQFRLYDMYKALFVSEDKARAQFQQEVGCSPHEYLTRLRVQQACRMFTHAHGETSVAEVAARVGVPDPQYFSRMFKQNTGLSPNAWIKENAQKQ